MPNSRGGHFRFFHFFPAISIYNDPPNLWNSPEGRNFFCKIRPFWAKNAQIFAYFSPFCLFFSTPHFIITPPNLWILDKKPIPPILLYPPTIRHLRVFFFHFGPICLHRPSPSMNLLNFWYRISSFFNPLLGNQSYCGLIFFKLNIGHSDLKIVPLS